MRRLAPAVACSFIVAACAPRGTPELAVSEGWSHFGAESDPTVAPMLATGALATGALADTTDRVVVEATVREVCQTNGCWMMVRDESNQDLLVRFRDYGFFVPRNATGRHALVYGTAIHQTLSVEALRRLAADAGKSATEIALVTEPRDLITFTADAVWIQGPGLADPYRPVGTESCPPLEASKD